MIKKLFLYICLFFLVFLLNFEAYAINSIDINELLNERIKKNYYVGIVVAIINNNGTKFYSYGRVSKQTKSKKINQFTLFPIASVTKVFTTLLLADAILHGYLQLNDPIQKYFPKIKIPTFGNKRITLKNLATHTSGLPSQFATFKNSDPYVNFTQKKLYTILNNYSLSRSPGQQFEYADINIGILGDIIEKIEHQKISYLIEALITRPLEMTDTKMLISPNAYKSAVLGYNAEDKPALTYHFPIFSSAGALYSTASDLAKFVAANLGIKKTNLKKAMLLTHIPYYIEGPPMKNFDYPGIETLYIGLGWNIDRQYHLVWKNGNFPGFSSFIGFNQQKKLGIVVLANTGNIIYVDNLAMHLLNSKIPLLPLYHEIHISSSLLKAYIGKYEMADNTYYYFLKEGNHLKVMHKVKDHYSSYFNIYPKSKTHFFGRISDTIFIFSYHSKKINLLIEENGQKMQGRKIS